MFNICNARQKRTLLSRVKLSFFVQLVRHYNCHALFCARLLLLLIPEHTKRLVVPLVYLCFVVSGTFFLLAVGAIVSAKTTPTVRLAVGSLYAPYTLTQLYLIKLTQLERIFH